MVVSLVSFLESPETHLKWDSTYTWLVMQDPPGSLYPLTGTLLWSIVMGVDVWVSFVVSLNERKLLHAAHSTWRECALLHCMPFCRPCHMPNSFPSCSHSTESDLISHCLSKHPNGKWMQLYSFKGIPIPCTILLEFPSHLAKWGFKHIEIHMDLIIETIKVHPILSPKES